MNRDITIKIGFVFTVGFSESEFSYSDSLTVCQCSPRGQIMTSVETNQKLVEDETAPPAARINAALTTTLFNSSNENTKGSLSLNGAYMKELAPY